MKFYFPLEDEQQTLDRLDDHAPLEPFHPVVLQFIAALSQRFIKLRQFPEIVALGYWMRKANIALLQQQWEESSQGRIIKARGTVFHIAPSNVDTIFIYSWLLSLLAGNRNIIRLSSKEQPQQHTLLQVLLAELADPVYELLAQRNILLTYVHNDHTTEQLSKLCHVRVVWGGDSTVGAVRRIPLAPMASELVFADRFSMSLLQARAINDLEQDKLVQLTGQFYNDAYWFDQLACSSPRLIVWQGTQDEVKQAQLSFWHALEQVHASKQDELQAALQVQKLTTSLWLAASESATGVRNTQAYSSVMLDMVTGDVRERHCGGGFFLETIIGQLQQLAPIIADKDQTLTYFGYNRDELQQLASAIQTRGIDRIVPIGRALDFQEIWDGQSFLRSFTREVVII